MSLLSVRTFADDKRISVYSQVAIYSLPVVDRNGHEYVGLLELLEPLGHVSTDSDGRTLRFRYNAVDALFAAGKTRARIRGRDFDFASPFLIENSRGLVPLNSLTAVLPRFIAASITFHESSRRLFLGEVGTTVSFRPDSANPQQLILMFSAPVNPTIATEPGKLRLVFKRDPILSPGSQSISFDSRLFSQASFSEANGDAELDVMAAQPMSARFSPDRRLIIVSAVPPPAPAPPVAARQQNPPQRTSPQDSANPAAAVAPAPPPPLRRVLVIIDPAHGGEERGSALTDSLAEKDVSLGFARLLRHELQTRGFAVTLLRDSDIGLTLDQRAIATNTAHAGICITLHATSQANGIGLYSALLPAEKPNKGPFNPWDAAQAPSLPLSRAIAATVAAELQKKSFPVHTTSASLRPLNNVVVPAIAIELGPGPLGVADISSANYQQKVSASIADAIFSIRDRLELQP